MPHAFLSGRNISGPNLPLALGGSSDRSGPLDLQQRPQVPGGVIGLGGKKKTGNAMKCLKDSSSTRKKNGGLQQVYMV